MGMWQYLKLKAKINTNTANLSSVASQVEEHETELEEHETSLNDIASDVATLQSGGGNTIAGSILSENFTATPTQTEFTLTDISGAIFALILNGVVQRLTDNYTLNELKNIATLTEGAEVDDEIELYYFKPTAAIAEPMTEGAYALITPVEGMLYFLYADS